MQQDDDLGDHPSMRPPRETPPPKTPSESGSRTTMAQGPPAMSPVLLTTPTIPTPGNYNFMKQLTYIPLKK